MTLRDIDGDEAAKSHISICSTHSVRLSDPFNDGLLGGKIRKSAMEELEDLLLDSNVPVTGVDKGNHYKEKNRERVLKQIMQGSKDYWSYHRVEFSIPSPTQVPTTYNKSMCPAGL